MSLTEVSEYGRLSASDVFASARSIVKEPHPCERDVPVVFAQTSPRRVDLFKKLIVKTGTGDEFAMTHMSRQAPGHGMTETQTRCDAFVACVHLEGLDDYDLWCDGKHQPCGTLGPGTIHINDMRHVWQADIRKPFHAVNVHMPQSVLDEIAEEEGASRVDELCCPIGLAHVDTVFQNLALALLPALARSDQVNKLFADHAARAVTAHLRRTYGSLRMNSQSGRGCLAS